MCVNFDNVTAANAAVMRMKAESGTVSGREVMSKAMPITEVLFQFAEPTNQNESGGEAK